jgi:hypothetical protein
MSVRNPVLYCDVGGAPPTQPKSTCRPEWLTRAQRAIVGRTGQEVRYERRISAARRALLEAKISTRRPRTAPSTIGGTTAPPRRPECAPGEATRHRGATVRTMPCRMIGTSALHRAGCSAMRRLGTGTSTNTERATLATTTMLGDGAGPSTSAVELRTARTNKLARLPPSVLEVSCEPNQHQHV